jgi:hypothetical protein
MDFESGYRATRQAWIDGVKKWDSLPRFPSSYDLCYDGFHYA